MIIKVESVEELKTDKDTRYKRIKTPDGSTFSVWEKSPDGKSNPAFASEFLRPGDAVGIEFTEKGKYKNITAVREATQEVGKDTQPVTSKRQGGYGKSPEELRTERRSIERQVSVKLAVEMASDSDGLDAILRTAEQIYKWIAKLESHSQSPTLAKDKTMAESLETDAVSGTWPVFPIQYQPQTPEEVNEGRKHYWPKATAQQVLAPLGIKKLSDITDCPMAWTTLVNALSAPGGE